MTEEVKPRTFTDTFLKANFSARQRLASKISSLFFVPPLWMEICFSLFMTAASIWLLAVWIPVRHGLIKPWDSGIAIGAVFTAWLLLGSYVLVWTSTSIALLLFTFHYGTHRHSTSEVTWKRKCSGIGSEPVWCYGVCDIPEWPSGPTNRVADCGNSYGRSTGLDDIPEGKEMMELGNGDTDSSTNTAHVPRPIPFGRWSKNFWKTSDGTLWPLVMFEALEKLETPPTSEAVSRTQQTNQQNHPRRRDPPTGLSVFRGAILIALAMTFVFYFEQVMFIDRYRRVHFARPVQMSYGDPSPENVFQKNYMPSGRNLSSAVNVTMLWAPNLPLQNTGKCNKTDVSIDSLPAYTAVNITCPLALELVSVDNETSAHEVIANTPNLDLRFPDLLVTFDYSALGPLPQQSLLSSFSASLWMSLTPGPADNLIKSVPGVTLINNVHLIGGYTQNIRVKSRRNNRLATFLGMFEEYDNSLDADIAIYGSNLDTALMRSNTSSILLFQPFDMSYYRIIQDIPGDSFLQGLSNLGGIFTTFTGIFTFVFGFSILAVLDSISPGLKGPRLGRGDSNTTIHPLTVTRID
ncbi:hypothetical protein BOTBODRAFT_49100 [Botryobasidium botryosum FD-172 SS1]|uniref:Uncharacterized protein n=1 Tax=Botryobasidium botryosum (strain FD-172 SS1) TaxID=930990 RepID=A0A067LUE9_BOTB1|nr:hypothetical protein BOTBODRAFT_49100 [Botryobasidium botryosum FD-172 SS1]